MGVRWTSNSCLPTITQGEDPSQNAVWGSISNGDDTDKWICSGLCYGV